MRNGFTTGSCAAAATKAAVHMLLSGNRIDSVTIMTPAGVPFNAIIEDIVISENKVSCAVRKDSGDDPDVTNGLLIYAEVMYLPDSSRQVVITAGFGVGVVTRKGLDPKVGEAAINSVPRKMIEEAARQEMDIYDCQDSLKVVIFVPGGEEIAKKTFNPRLGIEGGISIIGTSGIVEAMSTKAIIDTIRVELNQKKEEGETLALVSPGNYGLDFMKREYDIDLNKAVKCSNYIGETIDIVRELGFKKMLIVGHIGKLIKVSGGIMNTHSKEADCRMELLAVAAHKCRVDNGVIDRILDSVSTEEAYKYIIDASMANQVSEYLMDRISYYLNKRGGSELNIECIMYSNELGLIGKTSRVDEYIK